MRLFSRLTLPLVVSLGLAAPASAAPFCAGLPEWAKEPCSAAIGWLAPWFVGDERRGGSSPGWSAEWLPEGPGVDPNGRREPPPTPPAPAVAPTDSPSDAL